MEWLAGLHGVTTLESPVDYAEGEAERSAYADFRRSYPLYDPTYRLDALRATEYARLDRAGHVYLDYTGGGLYADSQIRDHADLLHRNVLGNPHSNSPASTAATELAEQARGLVHEVFNASPSEYLVIFTPNATGALKLVGESYPFDAQARCMLTFDNHNSVVGIREFARHHGARLTYIPLVAPQLRVGEDRLLEELTQDAKGAHKLFAYPAQSNFSGVQHPLEWIAEAQSEGWDVLVDCAAYAPTNRLDLGLWHPDFVALSFYKIFGYPTGVGALIARKTALQKLRRPWFAGGTVWAATIQGDTYRTAGGAEAFEEGTINYLGLPAIAIGLKHFTSMGVESIHDRVSCLLQWLLEHLQAMHHAAGSPLVRLYGPPDMHRRGATIAMNFLDPRGRIIDERIVELRAGEVGISLRTGCFCNPGAGEIALNVSKDSLIAGFSDTEKTFQEFITALGAESYGAVRVSLGAVSNFSDVYAFARFASTFLDWTPDFAELPPRMHC